jgi:hypothetical protein
MIDRRVRTVLLFDSSEVSDQGRCRTTDRDIGSSDTDPLIGSETSSSSEISGRGDTIEPCSILYEASTRIVLDVRRPDKPRDSGADSPISCRYSREEHTIREEPRYERIGDTDTAEDRDDESDDFAHMRNSERI